METQPRYCLEVMPTLLLLISFFLDGKIGIFWIVEAGALVSLLVLLFLFRKEKQLIDTQQLTEVNDFFPTVLLLGIIILLILNSFVPGEYKPDAIEGLMNGIICMSLFAIGLIRKIIRAKNTQVIIEAAKSIDYDTILLLTGLFVVIGGMTEAGLVKDISRLFVKASGDNVFFIYSLIVWASVLFSVFIDNIPYVATMLPVTGEIASLMGIQPNLLYFGLLIGATLGGNITPIGASANITGIGILRKEGCEVSTGTFMKVSVPFTLSAVMTGYILTWLIWN